MPALLYLIVRLTQRDSCFVADKWENNKCQICKKDSLAVDRAAQSMLEEGEAVMGKNFWISSRLCFECGKHEVKI